MKLLERWIFRSARVRITELQTPSVQLSEYISGMCAAPEKNCVLLADAGDSNGRKGGLVRVSLAEKRAAQCLYLVPDSHTDEEHLSDVRMLPDGAHIALAFWKPEKTDKGDGYAHFVRLLARQSYWSWWSWRLMQADTWSVVDEKRFDSTFSNNTPVYSRLCISRNLIICTARRPSRFLVGIQVTHDSHLKVTSNVEFDSPIRAVCAFTSGTEHLVVTTHEDCSVRLWRHIEATAGTEDTFKFEECEPAVRTNMTFESVIKTSEGLLLQPDNPKDKIARFCRIRGTRLEEPIPQPQLGRINIRCGCSVELSDLIYDRESSSLLTLDF